MADIVIVGARIGAAPFGAVRLAAHRPLLIERAATPSA